MSDEDLRQQNDAALPKVYTKLQAAVEADYLKMLPPPFARWFSLLESKTRLLSSNIPSLAFHN